MKEPTVLVTVTENGILETFRVGYSEKACLREPLSMRFTFAFDRVEIDGVCHSGCIYTDTHGCCQQLFLRIYLGRLSR